MKWVWNPFHAYLHIDDGIMNIPSAPAYFVAVHSGWTDELGEKGIVVKQVVPCSSLTAAKVVLSISREVEWLNGGCVVTKPPKARAGVIYRVVED